MNGDYFMVEPQTRAAVPVSPQLVFGLFFLAFAFAAGMYCGVLLFGRHASQPVTVVACPAPGSTQVALWPAGCPREAMAP